MSIYNTPLQFGYFFALLFAIMLWWRGYKEERLNDTLLGFVLFFLGMEIQDYTFGFSGINILWEELNGLPRSFHLALAPTIYFYLRVQTNGNSRFDTKDWRHYLPYFTYLAIGIVFFCSGQSNVNTFQKTVYYYWINLLLTLCTWTSYAVYFYSSLKLYKGYSKWLNQQFSNTTQVSLEWLKSFIYLLVTGEAFRVLWIIVDFVIDLPFEKDWWWNLYTVAIIVYVGIHGYFQTYQHNILYNEAESETEGIVEDESDMIINAEKQKIHIEILTYEGPITKLFDEEKIFLEPNLTLQDVATRLKSNNNIVSAAINQIFKKNFNDFVNEYRVREFEKQVKNPKNSHLTFLAIAFDCGFNSKSTFNRAYKKVMGRSPREAKDEILP